MATSLTFLLVCCLLQGVLCDEFWVTLPATIEVISGSCVTIPCSFNIENKYETNLDKHCEAIWKSEDGSDFPDNYENRATTKEVTGDLTKKDCTTTFTNMRSEYRTGYYFRLDCQNPLVWTFTRTSVTISVKDNPPSPTLEPSTLTVKEGTSVSLTCSAPAPCWSHPPTLTWTSNLGHSEETLKEEWDKTKVKISVLNFTASHLHHEKKIFCTAAYKKQDGSTDALVQTSLKASISYSPKDTTVSVSPSGPVPENTNVTLTCSSNANPAVRSYTWYTADRHQETYIGNGHVLNIEASKVNSPFFCKAENYLGVGNSNRRQIDVQYSPKDTTVSVSPSGPVPENTNVTLTCSSNANPAVRNYTWYTADRHQGTYIGNGHVLNIEASKVNSPFFCKAENDVGEGRSNLRQIDVQYSPKDTTVSVSPSGPVPENTNVTLTCSSDANSAVRNYTWYTADRHQETYIGNGHVLNIEASKVKRAFFCKAENYLEAGCSNLSQIDVQFPPQILPSSDCTNTAGQVACSCEAMGNPAPTIDWYLDGLPVNQSGKFAISNETLNDTYLRSNITVTQPQGRDLSTLLCRSINSLGSASQKFCVTSLQSSAESQDRVMFLVIISTFVASLVLLCVLLFVIRALRNCHNLKSQITGEINTSQPFIREENEVPSTTQDDASGTNSAINTANLPSTGQHDAEAPSDSSKNNGASCDVIYSSVTWKSKKQDKSVDMTPSGSSYLEEAECRVGRNRKSFVSNTLEMGNLYDELEPRITRKEVECEYSQVKFKDKSTRKK